MEWSIRLLLGCVILAVFNGGSNRHALANEMTRCCKEGERQFNSLSTCTGLRTTASNVCKRSNSICCLRAMMDSQCEEGEKSAINHRSCDGNINRLGGGIYKECCDCCLLAKEVSALGQPCVPPSTFSELCRQSFSRCCTAGSSRYSFTYAVATQTDFPRNGGSNRCAQNPCDHFCQDFGGTRIQCSCRPGYELAEDGVSCRDIDECKMATHNCGQAYECRNTHGSFRCEPKMCGVGETMDPNTGECKTVNCPVGYRPITDGQCEDINECAVARRCPPFQDCINTPGSYRCEDQLNYCTEGYQIDAVTGACVDVDECAAGTHTCRPGQTCQNSDGGFKCKCPSGYDLNDVTKECQDTDECQRFGGEVCHFHATCENTPGSFLCHCKAGFAIAADGQTCEDVDECLSGDRCEQRCINIPGSFQCICDRGYTLSVDGRTCEDIDECSLWSGAGEDLCMGGCINTPGSYSCRCPSGYEMQEDGRTCRDVNECERGECQGPDKICVNTLGGYKCHVIDCPNNYIRDPKFKNVVQDGFYCKKRCHPTDVLCIANHTLSISYQYAALPSMKRVPEPLEVARVWAESLDGREFYVDYVMDSANRAQFGVKQEKNVGIVELRAPIRGPRTEVVRLHMNVYSRSRVMIGHNLALIRVYVSEYYF